MLTVIPTGAVLGATIGGLDLSQPLSDDIFGQLLAALGQYGVLRFPGQKLESVALKTFSERFGDIQGSLSKRQQLLECPGVGILSNKNQGGERQRPMHRDTVPGPNLEPTSTAPSASPDWRCTPRFPAVSAYPLARLTKSRKRLF